MEKFLVTGGSGFIGTNLIERLIKENYEVLNLDIQKPQNDSQTSYWCQVDILDYNSLEKIVLAFSPEYIIHLAAVTDLNGYDAEYYKANTEGTKNIIDVAKKISPLQKIIFTSSMYVCQPGYIPKDYDDYKPHTAYGESKRQGELLVKAMKNVNFDWVIVRPTSIWGPWFNVPYIDFFNVIYQKKYFNFDNTCTKTYGYIENTVYQFIKIIHSTEVHGKAFYLGDNPPIPISEWANEISLRMGKGKIRHLPFSFIKLAAFTGDYLSKIGVKFPMTSFRLKNMMTDNIFSLKDIYEITGNLPISRTEGVEKTIDWLSKHKDYRIL